MKNISILELSHGAVMDYKASHRKHCEIPFNSTNQFQVSIHETEDSSYYRLVMKGAPERILARCSSILVGEEEVLLNNQWKGRVEAACGELDGRGERVLGFCDLALPAENLQTGDQINLNGLRFIGMLSLRDSLPRTSLSGKDRASLEKLRQSHWVRQDLTLLSALNDIRCNVSLDDFLDYLKPSGCRSFFHRKLGIAEE